MEQILCIFCLDTFKSNENISVLSCGHFFHDLCLNLWSQHQHQSNCPQCRFPIDSKKCTKVYPSFKDRDCANCSELKTKSDVLKKESAEALRKLQVELTSTKLHLVEMEEARDIETEEKNGLLKVITEKNKQLSELKQKICHSDLLIAKMEKDQTKLNHQIKEQ